MQIMITHGLLASVRVLRLGRWQLGSLLALAVLLLAVLTATAYHFVFMKAAREGWPLASRWLPRQAVADDALQRDRYLRENLDAMARKVGEMQAKLVQLEAIGDRVSGLAGLPVVPTAARSLRAPAGTASSPRGAPTAPPGAQGGPFVPVHAPSSVLSMAQIDAMIAALDERAAIGADVFTVVEARLFETRLRALMVPNSRPIDAPASSGFGFRVDPFTGRAALHTGLDFPADTGTPILAAAGGVVLSTEFHPQYGQLVELDHGNGNGNGLVTRYAHASKVLVRAGDIVRRGQPIALTGSSGRSTGPHLHFEVMVDGVLQDPAKFLGGASAGPASSPLGGSLARR